MRDIEALLARPATFPELVFFSRSWSLRFFLLQSGYYQQSFPNEGKNIVVQGRDRTFHLGDNIYCSISVMANNFLLQLHSLYGASLLSAEAHRKLLARGVRPTASFTSLRFGETNRLANQKGIDQSLKGIGDFSNNIGVPTLGGTIQFDPSYNQTPILNSVSIGIQKGTRRKGKVLSPVATSLVLLSNIDIDGEVKVVNPDLSFRVIPDALGEKNLQEAVLEIAELPTVINILSIGSDGLGMSLLQAANEFQLGFDLHIDSISEEELGQLLSLPSLSGMLVILPSDSIKQVKEIVQQWDVHCTVLGTFSEGDQVSISNRKKRLVDLSLNALDGAKRPVSLHNNNRRPNFVDKANKFSYKRTSHSKDYVKIAKRILLDGNATRSSWMWQQLDHSSQLNVSNDNGLHDTHVIRVREANRLLLFTSNGNSGYLKADPYNGTLIAIAEAARKIIIAGGKPEAIVLTMNFGDATDGVVNWQLQHTLKAVNEACRRFHTPVLDVDISFGNQQISKKGALPILPTPIIGMVGSMAKEKALVPNGFLEEGHLIYMIGTPHNDINSSIYVKVIHSNPISMAPGLDLDEEYHIQQHFSKIIRKDLVSSAQSVSEGGLFLALLKASLVNKYGFEVETDPNFRKDTYLFGEHQSRIVITVKPEREDELINYLNAQNVPFTMLGEVTGDHFMIDGENFGHLSEWNELYNRKPY